MAKGSGAGPTREQGKRAGSNAPPTPCYRLRWPKALKDRLEKAGINTEVKKCKGV